MFSIFGEDINWKAKKETTAFLKLTEISSALSNYVNPITRKIVLPLLGTPQIFVFSQIKHNIKGRWQIIPCIINIIINGYKSMTFMSNVKNALEINI